MSTFAVVPVKSLQKSKTRLSGLLSSQERQSLTLTMLQDVLNAIKNSRVNRTLVVGSDLVVQQLAVDFGAGFLEEQLQGLNNAVNQANNWCIANNADSMLVLPVGIPLIDKNDINEIVELGENYNSVVISPSKNGGTNALLQTPPGILSPRFGSDSFVSHYNQALIRHIQARIYWSPRVMLDIDSEIELGQLLKSEKRLASKEFVEQVVAGTGRLANSLAGYYDRNSRGRLIFENK
jgi:2-phospho-L-lactate guanylyltransferase